MKRKVGRPAVRVSGLLVSGKRLLLVRQRRGASTYWLLPGGGVERGEALAEALVREFREEVGLDIRVEEPLGLVESISPDEGATRHTIQIIYRTTLTNPDLPNPSGSAPAPRDPAICETMWVDVDALPSLSLHPPIADLISAWMLSPEGRFVSAGVRWVD